MIRKILFAAACLATVAAGADVVRVFPQSFAEGGWKLDAQFMDVMGSPYLIAHGLGFPVPDATVEVAVPAAGEWRVWVRTRDWAEKAGRFQVLVNGAPLAKTFGVEPKEWGWVDGGAVTLAAGATTVSLRDLTGFDGRCAGIVLANAGERPEGAINILDEAPSVRREFDFVVVGGGVPGCCAAVAAARAGAKVALVQDRPVLGGNSSGEIRVWSAGEVRYPLVEEMRSNFMNMLYGNRFSDSDRLAKLQREPNLSIFLSHRAFAAVMKDKSTIAGVKALDLKGNRVVQFDAKLFCDVTGDGWVGFWAGAEWRQGREARSEFNEKYAPEKADKGTLGASIMWQSAVTTYDSPFSAPWAEPYACGKSQLNGDWNWEYGLDRDVIAEGEAVRDRLLLAIYGAFSNAKKDPANAHRKLVTCPFLLGKRESRRLMGDHVYCESDVVRQVQFEDAVATGSWSIDLHYTIDPKVPFVTRCEQPMHGRYWLPYRSIYSRNIGNLFMAGRCFSCTHVGLGGPRVINTLAQLGCAAGEAAAMCLRGGYGPRELYTGGHVRELQRRLGGDFPGNPDPAKKDWIVVDDENAEVAFAGKWKKYMLHCGGQIGDWVHLTGEKGATATYPLPVKAAGRYRLMGNIHHLFNDPEDRPVKVRVVSDGAEKTFVWHQQEHSGWWHELGELDLAPGAVLTVSAAKEGGWFFADGFALVPVR